MLYFGFVVRGLAGEQEWVDAISIYVTFTQNTHKLAAVGVDVLHKVYFKLFNQ